ncbi:Early nodulin-like protein [Quillaja saponaria]|uniref:Early nodulin-like protein n=1 Tax=Quillaja saponaria TaxID=32244 RepID=A0AAD7Q4I2_QUISA|nr:Early nodulin-like protein [Quillaja saponaria]
MASHSVSPSRQLVLLVLMITILSCLQYVSVSAFEFQVGDSHGWVVPPANDTKIYNEWASENRFLVGDSIRFRYKKDSVMEVTEADYKICNSTHPNFFSNTGNTFFRFEHSGAFYFISGVSGHCEKGQRVIVKVMLPEESMTDSTGKSSGFRAAVTSFGLSKVVLSQFVMSYAVVASHVI